MKEFLKNILLATLFSWICIPIIFNGFVIAGVIYDKKIEPWMSNYSKSKPKGK